MDLLVSVEVVLLVLPFCSLCHVPFSKAKMVCSLG